MGCGASKTSPDPTTNTQKPTTKPGKQAGGGGGGGGVTKATAPSDDVKKTAPADNSASPSPEPQQIGSHDQPRSEERQTSLTPPPDLTPSVRRPSAPFIAAYDDSGEPLPDRSLAYQGGPHEGSFVQGLEGDAADAPAPQEWVILAPGELPPDVRPEDVPAHYMPEEAARMQREEEEERVRREREDAQEKAKRIEGEDLMMMSVEELVGARKSVKKEVGEDSSEHQHEDGGRRELEDGTVAVSVVASVSGDKREDNVPVEGQQQGDENVTVIKKVVIFHHMSIPQLLPIPQAALVVGIRSFYLLAAAAVIFARITPHSLAAALYSYGKTLPTPNNRTDHHRPNVLQRLAGLTVPKHHFTHFYILGSIWVPALILVLCCVPPTSWPVRPLHAEGVTKLDRAVDPLLCLILMQVQVNRRLLECLGWVRNSGARMHLMHYAVGLAYYTVTPVAVVCERLGDIEALWGLNRSTGWILESEEARSAVWNGIRVRHFLAVALFVWASIEQNKCHALLAFLRDERAGDKMIRETKAPVYKLPKGGWFRLLACPHYTFEVLIYASMAVAAGWPVEAGWWRSGASGPTSALCVVVYVVVELGVVAERVKAWYEKKFAEEVPQRWWAIAPYIL
ncbi:Steroid 5 alpha-reductase 3 [Irineochytrium annulatum]|nr:Steroid 5 alpha-reductase 3 [Irineochytrium annulatum]